MAAAIQDRAAARLPVDQQPPAKPPSAATDVAVTVVLVIGCLLFLGWIGYIVWLALSLGPVTTAGLFGIASYLALLLYLVWKSGAEEAAEHEQH